MRHFLLAFLLLTASVSLQAQPWTWEVIDEYWDPEAFPKAICSDPTYAAMGDLDGDGQDEYFDVNVNGCRISKRDADRFHWRTTVIAPSLITTDILGVEIFNLDEDPAEEIVLFGYEDSATWEVTSASPWTLAPRPDLLAGLFFPDTIFSDIVWADFDGDADLDAAVIIGNLWEGTELRLYASSAGSDWILDTVFTSEITWQMPFLSLLNGDFNHDGRVDLGVVCNIYDAPPVMNFVDFSTGEAAWHNSEWFSGNWVDTGDVDGDGIEDLLGLSGRCGAYDLAVSVADSVQFARFDYGRLLEGFWGTPIATLQNHGQPFVVVLRSSFEISFMGGFYSSSYTAHRRGDVWGNFAGYGLGRSHWFHVSAGVADLDGDGLRDFMQVQLGGMEIPGRPYAWWLWKNVGDAGNDRFAAAQSWQLSAFTENPDTTFSDPQLGDVDADGNAEMAVLAKPAGRMSQVMFYSLNGPIEDLRFHYDADYSSGLPAGLQCIRMADIDNDARAELFGREDGLHWTAYFHRNGLWVPYPGVLPPMTSNDLMFLDVDEDGDADLMTPDTVWRSLHPDVAEEEVVSVPESFALSAFPNPFNTVTTIRFTLATAGVARLSVYDLLGREAAVLLDGRLSAGAHETRWDALEVAAGVYFVHLSTPTGDRTQKLLFLK